jgi:hypothetical protein
MTQGDVTQVHRRQAASGTVGYGDPVIIHETSRSRVSFIPYFIARSDHTELAIKLQTYKKAPPPHDWVFVEEKSLSLKEEAARLLLDALSKHLAVASQNEDGTFLLLRLGEQTTDLGSHDPQDVARALTRVLSREDIAKHLEARELSKELICSLRTSIRLREMQEAVESLRTHLQSGQNVEQIYQDWCQQHSWAFGNAYVVNDNIRNISATDNIDILLPSVIAGYRDLVELKRPDMDVLQYDTAHRNHYWSSHVSKAIGQCHRYLDVLHEVAAKGLRDHPEIVAYHPRAIIVIGRSDDWDTEKLRALHGLNHRLNNVTVMTYDQLLSQGERLLQMLSTPEEESDAQDDPFADWGDSF